MGKWFNDNLMGKNFRFLRPLIKNTKDREKVAHGTTIHSEKADTPSPVLTAGGDTEEPKRDPSIGERGK